MFWTEVKLWFSTLLIKRSKLDYLRKFPILNDFTDHELFLFSQIVQERSFKEGELVYQEEFPLAVIYLVLKGAIELKDSSHEQVNSIILNTHQFLGIIDLYTENKRKGEARAIKDSIILAVSHLDFMTFIRTNPKTGVKLMNNICRALSHTIYEMQNSVAE